MANFRILEGKSLKAAIKGASAKIATFAQLQHELCYGAALHLENHNDAIYVQSVYDMMPSNYKGTVREWFTAFAKCKFNAKENKFELAAGKESDMTSALNISPAEYQKTVKAPKADSVFDELAYLQKVLKKLNDSGASAKAVRGIEATLRALTTPAVEETAKIVKKPVKKPAKAQAAQGTLEGLMEAQAA